MVNSSSPKLRLLRNHTESGAVLIEAAVTTMLLALIALGILEYMHIFGRAMDISSAARSAARAGTLLTTTQAPSDYVILQTLDAAPHKAGADITRVVVFKADAPDGKPPAACLANLPVPPGNNCNVYLAGDLNKSQAQIDGMPGTQATWPASARQAGTDYLGVYIEVTPAKWTQLVPSPSKFRDQAVMKLTFASTGSGSTGLNGNGFTSGAKADPWPPNLPGAVCLANNCQPQDGSRTGDSGTGGGSGG